MRPPPESGRRLTAGPDDAPDVGRDPGEWVQRGIALTIGVVLVVGLVWLGIQALNVLVLVFVAILLAAGLEPALGSMRARLPIGLASSILLGYGIFVVAVVVVAFLVVPTALSQIDRFATELPASLERARAWAQTLQPEAAASTVTAIVDSISRTFAINGPPKADEVVQVGLTLAEVIASLVTLLALVFFWLTEHARLQRYALAFVSLDRRAGMREAWDEVENRLGLWVRGQLILMGSMAIATGAILLRARPPLGTAPGPHRRVRRGDPDGRPADRGDPGAAGRGHGRSAD